MSVFLLVHGACHGGWCWEKVKPLLERAGHRVVSPDLPAHGSDSIPPAEGTLAGAAESVCELVDSQSVPVVLVGHSMGGAVVSEVAERRPDKVALLVYLSAYLLPHGTSINDAQALDLDSLGSSALDVDADAGIFTMRPDKAAAVLYGGCSDGDAEAAVQRLVPEALALFGTPVNLGDAYGHVRRVYIACQQDRAITLPAQRRMYSEMPCEAVAMLDTGHSPFLSAPEELVGHLVALAGLASWTG